MAEPLRIREATLLDVDALKEVIEAAYLPYRQVGLSLPPVSDGLAADISNHKVWVAEYDGEVVGCVVVSFDGHAKIQNLAVAPIAAGKGIGRALLSKVSRQGRTNGLSSVQLTTHAKMAETLAFYQRLGWIETGREGEKVYLALEL